MRRIAMVWIVCASCGSSNSGGDVTLDCAWIASNNCWKQVAAGASSCLPAASEAGTLSADDLTCTYASGDVVTSPASLLTVQPTTNVTVMHGAEQCLHFESGSGAVVLETSAGTATVKNDGVTVEIDCPDGSRITAMAANVLALTGCTDAGAHAVPGHHAAASGSDSQFWVDGTDVDDLEIYDCHTP